MWFIPHFVIDIMMNDNLSIGGVIAKVQLVVRWSFSRVTFVFNLDLLSSLSHEWTLTSSWLRVWFWFLQQCFAVSCVIFLEIYFSMISFFGQNLVGIVQYTWSVLLPTKLLALRHSVLRVIENNLPLVLLFDCLQFQRICLYITIFNNSFST